MPGYDLHIYIFISGTKQWMAPRPCLICLEDPPDAADVSCGEEQSGVAINLQQRSVRLLARKLEIFWKKQRKFPHNINLEELSQHLISIWFSTSWPSSVLIYTGGEILPQTAHSSLPVSCFTRSGGFKSHLVWVNQACRVWLLNSFSECFQ